MMLALNALPLVLETLLVTDLLALEVDLVGVLRLFELKMGAEHLSLIKLLLRLRELETLKAYGLAYGLLFGVLAIGGAVALYEPSWLWDASDSLSVAAYLLLAPRMEANAELTRGNGLCLLTYELVGIAEWRDELLREC